MFRRVDRGTITGSIVVTSVFIAITIYMYMFLFNAANDDSGSRYDKPFLILLVSTFIISIIKGRSIKLKKDFRFREWLLVFLALYSMSALLTLDISRSVAYLPTLLFTITSFYFFFYYSYYDKISYRALAWFVAALTFIFIIKFFQILFLKVDVMGDNFYKQSNNSGYLFIALMPITLIVLNKRMLLNTVIITLFMLFVLFSMKRGAILTGSIVYIYIILSNFKAYPLPLDRIRNLLISFVLLTAAALYVYANFDMFIYRFELEGGSGRDDIYPSIFNNWVNGSFLNVIFGSGFFSTLDITSKIFSVPVMAHSDWLEVLSDLGLIGLLNYSIVFIAFYKQLLNIKKYNPYHVQTFTICLIIWLLKSIFSGVFMDKSSIFLFIGMGIVLGTTYRNKRKITMQRHISLNPN